MEGSSNYFVKPEQVAVLPCLLCHSFPAAARLYLICLSFSTSPDSFCNPLFCNAWIAAVCSHPSLPSLRRQNVERVGNRLFFLPFHSSQVLSCIQSGKVAFSLSSDHFSNFFSVNFLPPGPFFLRGDIRTRIFSSGSAFRRCSLILYRREDAGRNRESPADRNNTGICDASWYSILRTEH